ncbi:unnamed protein product, partial [Phaeothamnion confervicola]
FSTLPISEETARAIREVLKYNNMTMVQELAMPVCLEGVDVLARAKTGTGKTLAFLIPAIERAARARAAAGGSLDGTSCLVISPTRELAAQIAKEAELLATFHGKGRDRMTVDIAVGGACKPAADLKRFRGSPPVILVATPGRLLDHLENGGLRPMFRDLDTLVLDEADRLLDMGFKRDVEKILSSEGGGAGGRQALMFSATLPDDVASVASSVLASGYRTIDCIGEQEDGTHAHVPQEYMVVPLEQQAAALMALLADLISAADGGNHKIIVFFAAARLVQLHAALAEALGLPVLETHSRKSQAHRDRVSEEFRRGRNIIMFTSDVSARGLDYPDVTTVVQVGLPTDRAQYIHRLGRTARAGKDGRGILLLADFERRFLKEVSDL